MNALHFEADLEITLDNEPAIQVSDDRDGGLIVTILDRKFLFPLLRMTRLKLSIPFLRDAGMKMLKGGEIKAIYRLKQTTVAELEPHATPSFLARLFGLGDIPIRIHFFAAMRAFLLNR